MGDGKGTTQVSAGDNPYAQQAAAIAGGQYQSGVGLTSSFIRDMSRILGAPNPLDPNDPTIGQWDKINAQKANYDITQLPTYQPLFGLQKQSLEKQYQLAKQNIMGANPQGGNLTGALTNLEANRAATMGALPAQVAAPLLQDWINKAYGMATGLPQQSLAGLGSAANTYSNLQSSAMAADAANQQSTYGLLGGVGQGIGKAVGGAMGK